MKKTSIHTFDDSLSKLGELSDKDFNILSKFIYEKFGIKIPYTKKYLLKSRLVKRIKALEMNSYSEYVKFVLGDKKGNDEVIEMMDVVSTNKTDFFREFAHFEFLKGLAIPEIINNGITFPKIWSAGCSSGEEVYSIAMVLEDEVRLNRIKNYNVYGTDISVTKLKTAVKAIYPYSDAENIPSGYRERYLLKSKGKFNKEIRIVKAIRDKMKFQWLNLADTYYKINKDFDVIFCRNTLIYFDKPVQLRVVNNLLQHLKVGGYLLIGHSESLLNYNINNIKQIGPSIYKKLN